MTDVPATLTPPRQSRAASGFRRALADPTAVVAGLALLVIVLAAIFAGAITPYEPKDIGAGRPLTGPGSSHWFGTDELGRDVFSRVLQGLRVSLSVALLSSALATIVGVAVGVVAGSLGGFVDDILMRVTEAAMIIPRFVLALVMVAFFGASTRNLILVIGLLSWPLQARVVRAEVLSVRQRQFVQAARLAGAGRLSILCREIAPNVLGVIIVTATLVVGQTILVEAGLSYLGLGDPNAVSLGLMLQQAQGIMRSAWWSAIFPGLAVFVAVLATNLLGDSLSEILNPRGQGA